MGEQLVVSEAAYGSGLARVLVGTVLVIAGVSKLFDAPAARKAALRAYVLPSPMIAGIAAHVLPPLEIVLGALLLIGFLMPLPAFAAVALFALFALTLGLSLIRGRVVSCMCLGVRSDEQIGWGHVGIDLVLAGAAWISAGSLWDAAWSWPFALIPAGMHIQGTEAVAIVLDAWGVLSLMVLLRMAAAVRGFADPTLPSTDVATASSTGETLTIPGLRDSLP